MRPRCWGSGWPPSSSVWSASWTFAGWRSLRGASSTAVWLRERLRLSGRSARQLVQLAATIDAAPTAVRDALLGGATTVEQGRVVAETIAALPVEAGPEAADKATQLLVAWADRFDPTSLSRLGERVLVHVAPELADQAELKALERATERAEARRHVTLSEQQTGQVRLSGNLDTETASLLREAIDPLCAPAGEQDARSPGQRRADAGWTHCVPRVATSTTCAAEAGRAGPRRPRPRPAAGGHDNPLVPAAPGRVFR
ncbi:DUF222 domain-containing protein [Micromonospora parva]|uniref:DUF222 domain-containing protein n=1 Tax=Micromonospora parva TaxID=1464048 RepID=UPI00366AAFE1